MEKLKADIAKSEALAQRTPEQLEAERRAALRSLLDLALVPPEVNVKPDRRHSFAQLDFTMSMGMTRTDKGRLFAVWHGGEDGPKSFIVGSWSDDDGKTWTDTRFTVGTDRPFLYLGEGRVFLSSIMGNIWFAPDGTLRLYVHRSLNMFDSRGALFEFVCRNPDAAEPSWSRGRMIAWGGTHNHPIVLKDGTWLLPNNFEDFTGSHGDAYADLAAQRGCGLLASKDAGRTWTPRGYVRPKGTRHYTEHSIVDFDNGRLRMYLRTGRGLMISDSEDEGATWSEPRYDDNIRQAVSRSGTIRLRDGRLVLVKNGDRIDKVTPRGKGKHDTWGMRNELTVFLSDDMGKTWKGGLVIDERNDVAYPDIFEGQDGFVYMAYDHGRNSLKDEYLFARVTPEDILAQKIVTPGSSLKNVIFSEKVGQRHPRTF